MKRSSFGMLSVVEWGVGKELCDLWERLRGGCGWKLGRCGG